MLRLCPVCRRENSTDVRACRNCAADLRKVEAITPPVGDVGEAPEKQEIKSSGITSTSRVVVTTTPDVEGKAISEYLGIVVGETIVATNIFRDIGAGFRDLVGGRSGSYEKKMNEARETAIVEMEEKARALGANAVVGVDLDYETVGNNMMMVSAAGTAVRLIASNKTPVLDDSAPR